MKKNVEVKLLAFFSSVMDEDELLDTYFGYFRNPFFIVWEFGWAPCKVWTVWKKINFMLQLILEPRHPRPLVGSTVTTMTELRNIIMDSDLVKRAPQCITLKFFFPLKHKKPPLNVTLSSKFGSYIFNQLNVSGLPSDFKAEDLTSPPGNTIF